MDLFNYQTCMVSSTPHDVRHFAFGAQNAAHCLGTYNGAFRGFYRMAAFIFDYGRSDKHLLGTAFLPAHASVIGTDRVSAAAANR